MIKGLSHTNIHVRDIDKCLPFYRDVLGLEVTFDDGTHKPSNFEGRRAVFLRWGSGPQQSFVVLQSFPSDGDEAEAAPVDHMTKLLAMGLNHFGFWVDDLDTILSRASSACVQLVRAPVSCIGRHYGYDTTSEEPWVRTVQLIDPENNVIQLDQWVMSDTD